MGFGKGSPTLTALLQGRLNVKTAAGASVESAMMGSAPVNAPGMADVAGVQPSPVPMGAGAANAEGLRQMAEETNDPIRKQILLTSADQLDISVNAAQPPMDPNAYPPPEQATPRANVVYEQAGQEKGASAKRTLNDFVDDDQTSYQEYGLKTSSVTGVETAYAQNIDQEIAENNFLDYLEGSN